MNSSLLLALTDKELEDTLGGDVLRDREQPITISGKCHPNAAMVVIFEVESSSLLLACPVCSQLVARIAIAKSEVH